MRSTLSKRSLHEAYDTGKRGLNWADTRIKKLEEAFRVAAPVLGVLQPDLLPALAATKMGFMNYDNARTIAVSGDKIKDAFTM